MTTCKIFILPILAVLFNVSLFSQSKVENLIAGTEAKVEAVDARLNEIENKIQAAFDSVMTYKKYVDKLDSARLFNLPVSILGSGKDSRYGILIDDVILKPEGAYFNASMLMTNPFDGSRMCFQAQNIPFSFSGGIVGDARIMLVSQKKFTICSGVQLFVLPGTYVEFNCNGFKALNLKGKVVFSGDKFVKVNAQGDSIGGPLEAYFETTVNDWNNLFLSIEQLDPFKLKSVPDVIFSCKNLAIDYSDYRNPSNIVFPASYASSFPEGSANLWRGVYMTEATIMLDKKFKRKDSQSLISFAAKNLLIDEKGLSGELSGKNLLTLQEGDLGGWNFSLEYFNIKLDASRIKAANFNGQIMIPAFKDSTKFGYSALIDTEGKYNFTVTTQSDLPFELFGKSKLTINKSSYISITVDKGKFKPVACLSGALDINVSNMKMAGIRFEELRIATEAPVISVKNLAVDANMQGAFANFPLTVNNIDFKMPGDLATLKFKVKLNLMGSSDEGFSGLCDITLKARRENYKYKLEGVQINEIKVDVVKDGAFEIHGQIMFAREDPVYGNGFRGMINAKFASTFEVKALAIFGNVKGTRYFFVDAFLGIKPGIQAGPITLYGFSGGLYYHMKQDRGANPDSSSFGSSLSGLVYKPDSKIGIGIMAGVKFGVVKEQLIDADVKFEIVFNSSGGLNRVYFEGNAKCIVPNVDIVPAKLKEAAQKFAGGEKLPFNPTDAAIAASVTMEMDFEKHSFHSMIGVYINVGPIIKGVGANGKAGWCVLHIDQDKWYLHIGSPTDPIGLKFLSLFEAKSYFMVGHEIPTELPLNPQVADILRINPADLSSNRDDGQLTTGKGIAFGASVRFNTGDLTFLIFYASFDFGAGFDIMLVDMGSKSYCAGHNPPVGINGWYAKGQVYAYLKGEVGLKAKIFGKTRRFEILSLAVAAMLRAEAPNPTYILGVVGGRYKVFGGLIKGECKFKVEIGEKCQLVRVKDSPAPTDVPVIAEVTPGTDALDVDVFVLPQVVFNIPINKEFKISDDNDITKTYRIKLEKLELVNGGNPVTILQTWNTDNSVVALEPDEILKSKDKYTLNVAISFEEYVNGKWKVLTDDGGGVFTENRAVSFTTGLLPDRIPPHLISYSYPIDKQYNFYKGEYPQAYMMFSRNLSVYFNDDNNFTHECQWVENSGQKIRSRINYNPGERTVYADVPANLKNNTIYDFSFVSVPRNTNSSSDRNVIINKTSVDLGDSTSAEMTTKEAEGMLSSGEEKVFYDHYFRTSRFNKLSEKIPFDTKDVDFLFSCAPFVFYPQINMPISEVFDNYELTGDETHKPLLRRTAVLSNTNWYQDEVYPLLYKNYSWFSNVSIQNRDTSVFGMPPTRAIQFYYRNPITLTEDEIATGISQFAANTGTEYMFYKLPYYWDKDYYDIRNYLANKFPSMTNPDPAINKVLKNFDFPIIQPGNYPVLLEYVLPGKNIVTFSKYMALKNNIMLNF
jgi:hypothetical protein